MQDLLYKIVERMLSQQDSFSRNKNFEAFNDPRLHNATRIVRHIKALRSDILRLPLKAIRLEPLTQHEARTSWRLSIAMEDPEGHRTAYLSEQELDLLCLNPQVADILRPLVLTQDPKTPGDSQR